MNIRRMKEMFATGNYIRIAKSKTFCNIPLELLKDDDDYWIEESFEYFLIHKKHKDILDAYLLDNDVGIEYKSITTEKWLLEEEGAFIEEYVEEDEYRLKQKREFNFIEHDMPETIQSPNSDIRFLKPEFECELLKVTDRNIIGTVYQNESHFGCSWDFDGFCLQKYGFGYSNMNLTPYKEKKEWYEDESNFPCVVVFGSDNISRGRIATKYNKEEDRLYFGDIKYSNVKGWNKIEFKSLELKR